MIRGASSRLWSAGAGAAVAVCSYYTGQAVVSVCDSQKVNLLGLSAWLDSRGVDVKGIAFRQTKVWCVLLDIASLLTSVHVAKMHGVGMATYPQ